MKIKVSECILPLLSFSNFNESVDIIPLIKPNAFEEFTIPNEIYEYIEMMNMNTNTKNKDSKDSKDIDEKTILKERNEFIKKLIEHFYNCSLIKDTIGENIYAIKCPKNSIKKIHVWISNIDCISNPLTLDVFNQSKTSQVTFVSFKDLFDCAKEILRETGGYIPDDTSIDIMDIYNQNIKVNSLVLQIIAGLSDIKKLKEDHKNQNGKKYKNLNQKLNSNSNTNYNSSTNYNLTNCEPNLRIIDIMY